MGATNPTKLTQNVSRRDLLKALSMCVVASGSSRVASGFSRTGSATLQSASMRLGYAAITWGDAVTQAIDDIAAVGFSGIQLRSDAFAQFRDRPGALRELLQRRRLTLVALSSGNLSIDPRRERDELETHLGHAAWVRDVGGTLLQVIDERPKGRPVEADDYRRLGRLITELGKRTADLGVPLVYHHHMNSIGERPSEIAAVLDAADPRHVGLLLDIAHYQQGGGDPVRAVRQYRDWLRLIHLKDVESPVGSGRSGRSGGSGESGRSYRFVELGRGKVDVPAAVAALIEVAYGGWAIVELDRVPDPGRTPKESAEINKRYLQERLHLTV